MFTLRFLVFCVLLLSAVSFSFDRTILINSCMKRSTFIRLAALNDPAADNDDDSSSTGYFRLPNDENNQDVFPLDNYFLEKDGQGKQSKQNDVNDATTRQSVLRQLEFAFDNYQPWEVIEMSEKLYKMPEQFSKIRELCLRLDSLEAMAETQGWSENMVDVLRSTRSEIRMYGKDTEFYDFEGNRNESPSIQFPFWPFGKR